MFEQHIATNDPASLFTLSDEDFPGSSEKRYESWTFDNVHCTQEEWESAAAIFENAANDPRVQQAAREFIEIGDRHTLEHMRRACGAAVLIGLRMGLEEADLYILARGALVHDWGKADPRIQEALAGASGLDPGARELQHRHPAVGVTRARQHGFTGVELGIIGNHHLYASAEGDNYGVGNIDDEGNEVPRSVLLEQIMTIADQWDALCSERQYPKPWLLPGDAAEVILAQTAGLDPTIVRAYQDLVLSKDRAEDVA